MKLNIVVEISNDIEIDKNVSHKLKIALSQWQFPIRPDAIVWVWVLAHPSICASHDDAFDRFTVQYFIYKLCISFVVCWWDADTTPLTTSQIIIRDIFRECHAPIGRYVPAPCRCDLMTVQFEFSAAIPHLLPAWFNGRFEMKCTSLATICFFTAETGVCQLNLMTCLHSMYRASLCDFLVSSSCCEHSVCRKCV